MPKREHLDEVVERIQIVIANSRIHSDAVTLRIPDVERLINASIWGDD